MATDLDILNLNCPYLQQTCTQIIQDSIFRNINFPVCPDCPDFKPHQKWPIPKFVLIHKNIKIQKFKKYFY